MKKGVHTIRSGITSADNPSVPRRYSLDNGNFEVNMKITSFEVFPIGNDQTGGNNDKFGSDTTFFILATAEQGAVPFATTTSVTEYGPTLNLRPSDARQIGWGILSPGYGYVETFLDPEHIIPEDLYVNAYSISTAGSIVPVFHNVGFMINMEQVKSTGSEALLYQVKERSQEA
tara:strand:+ start:1644 stop:2165 length:522 start_codon:yes stop_codon:yes gene_type:complete